jgi:hypothetical protein
MPPEPRPSSRRPAGIQGTPSRHLCNLPGCGKPFTQRRELLRHLREVHRVGVGAYRDWHCVPCGESWPSSRGYTWKGHLVKVHPEADADEEYKNAKKNGRSFEPQERNSSPILGRNRQVRAESQVHPPTPPLPATAMTNPPLVSLPASAFPQVDYAELTIMGSERDDIRKSEALNSTRAGTLFSLTEERSQIAKDPDAYNYTQHWLAHAFAFTISMISDLHHSLRQTNSRDGCPAVGLSSNLVPPALMAAPPVSEYHGNLVLVTHAMDPPISTSSSLAHALDDGIWTNGLAESSPSGGPYADIDFSWYWPGPSPGYQRTGNHRGER